MITKFLKTFLGLVIAGNSMLAQIPTDGLIGYWPFHGDANDQSGNANNCDIHGAVLTSDRFNDLKNAYSFNGVDNFISRNSILNGQDNSTISFWIYSYGATQKTCPLVYDGDGDAAGWGSGYGICVDGSNQIRILQGNVANDVSNCNIQQNAWTNYVLVKSGTSFSFYENGVLKRTLSSTPRTPSVQAKLFIGGQAGNYFFNGKIDDIHIYNCALSSAEILSLHNVHYEFFLKNDTIAYNVSSQSFQSLSPKTYSEKTDSLKSKISGCDSIVRHFSKYVYSSFLADQITLLNNQVTALKADTTTKGILSRKIYNFAWSVDSSVATKVYNTSTGNFNISIFPNPTPGQITVSSSESITELILSNTQGQIILQLQPNSTETSFVLDKLIAPASIYFVKITTSKGVSTHKILITK
jgi:hypothetical protein